MIDLASLVLAPTAVKDGKVYNAIPNDQDFSFSRGTEATRVNSAGLIEKARTNFLLQSNTFDTTWINVNSSETGGQTGYDGTSDAWLITLSGGTATKLITQSLSAFSGIYTASFYAKAGTHSIIQWGVSSQTDVFVAFDLSDGSVGSLSAKAIDASATSVEGGWYKIQVAFQASGSAGYSIAGVDSLSATRYQSTSSTGNFYIQSAQLEQGLVSTDYIDTTTSSVTVGVTDDLPRVDYSGGGCPSLLLESSRTNINTQSEYFGSSSWNKARMSITDNALTSPEGVQNGANFVEDSTSNSHPLYDTFTVSSGTSYTISMFVKKGSRDYFRFNAATSSTITFFNLANGTVHSGTGVIEDFGNGWYRCSMSFTATSTSEEIYIEPSINGSSANYQGDGSVSMSIYGFQLESGSYVSSYLPTYGTSTSRSADSCSLTNASNLIGQTEGTLFAEFEINADNTNGYNRVLAVGDGTSNNRIFIFAQNTEVFRFYVANGGAAQVDIVSTTSILGGRHKVAFAYKENDFIAYVDGVQVGTDTSGTIPSCSNVYVGTHEAGSTQPLEGELSQAILFPTRLTNDQLAEITK